MEHFLNLKSIDIILIIVTDYVDFFYKERICELKKYTIKSNIYKCNSQDISHLILIIIFIIFSFPFLMYLIVCLSLILSTEE